VISLAWPRATAFSTIINQDNYIGMLADALAAFSGENYVAPLNVAVELVYGLLSEAFPGTESGSPTLPTTYACSNGGTAFFENSVLDMRRHRLPMAS